MGTASECRQDGRVGGGSGKKCMNDWCGCFVCAFFCRNQINNKANSIAIIKCCDVFVMDKSIFEIFFLRIKPEI